MIASAEQVVADLGARGIHISAEPPDLFLEPDHRVTARDVELVRARKPELLLLLVADEVRWRAAEMFKRVPSCGPVRFLVAREVDVALGGYCQSCGDTIPANEDEVGEPPAWLCGGPVRCEPCREAAWIALALRRDLRRQS
jgi:hypothetical protein